MTKMKKTFYGILDVLSWVLIWMNLPIITLLMGLAYVVKPIKRFCIDFAKSRLFIWVALKALIRYLRDGSDFSDSYDSYMYDITNELYDILEKETEA